MNNSLNLSVAEPATFSAREPLYLDYAATTPLDPAVVESMTSVLASGGLSGCFANAGSRSHIYGWQAESLVEKARASIASLIGADVREIYFTSGATEANNIVLKGVVDKALAQGKALSDCHIISSSLEHKAILDPLAELAKRGCSVTLLNPDHTGAITLEALEAALTNKTLLVSLMHINNELGTLSDIGSLASFCREKGVLFHSDCSQSLARVPIDFFSASIDFASFSAHKIYGPKGIGFLYVKRSSQEFVQPISYGGGQERCMRPGTLAVHQLVGMGSAAEFLQEHLHQDILHLKSCEDAFIQSMVSDDADNRGINPSSDPCSWFSINAKDAPRVKGILNICFTGRGPLISGDELVAKLQGLAISTGSACTSASVEPSHVLRGIGLTRQKADSCIRFSFGRFTSVENAHDAGRFVARKLRN